MPPHATKLAIADRLLAAGAISARRHRTIVAGDDLTTEERIEAAKGLTQCVEVRDG
jgi:hypothetical protein